MTIQDVCENFQHVHSCSKITMDDIRKAKYLMKDAADDIDTLIIDQGIFFEFIKDLKTTYNVDVSLFDHSKIYPLLGINSIITTTFPYGALLCNYQWITTMASIGFDQPYVDHREIKCVMIQKEK